MIILRQKSKIFSQTSPMPDPFPIPSEWSEYEVKIRVKGTKRYDKELPLFTKEERNLIKKYWEDLENYYIYQDHPDRPQGKTEYLAEFSKPTGQHKKFHRLTKRININDRFDYLVYPPELEKQDDGTYKVIIRVVIQSLKDHNIAGQRKYSNIEEN